MRSSRAIDLSTGLFVLLGFAAIVFLVTQITNREFSLRSDSYRLQAQFENVGGLKAGAPVSMAGVTVGRVESIGAGTGSEFSVLPAQNANGNWVKVTQRVPVRIAIDGTPPRAMIAGLSTDVTIDTGAR